MGTPDDADPGTGREFVDPTGGEPSAEIHRLRVMFRSRGERTVPPISRMREEFEAFSRLFPAPEEVAHRADTVAGVAVERLVPPQSTDGAFLYFHGGGYVSGSLATHRALAARLALAAGLEVVNVEYRRAPENPFPAAAEDAAATYRALLREHRADRLVIGGDSAGGALAVAALLDARDAGEPMPAAAVLLSPWTDLAATGESIRTLRERDPVLTPEGIEAMAEVYLAGADPRTPLASPLYADLDRLPPILIQVGADEILLDDSTRLAARLRNAGNQTRLEVWSGMIHGWQYFGELLPESDRALEKIAAFVRKHATDRFVTIPRR